MNKIALVQYPKKISISNRIFNQYFKISKLNFKYEDLSFSNEDFDKKINKLLDNYYALNITVPYKEKIMNYISPNDSSKKIGAVNCIYNNIGYNTDWLGFFHSIKSLPKKITVLGAGGAAKAIIYALYKKNIKEITLVNRNTKRALSLKKEYSDILKINVFPLEKLSFCLKKSEMFINASSLGMFGEKIPFLEDSTNNLKYIYDVVYFNTPLQKFAKRKNIFIQNGFLMWQFQALNNLKIWNINSENFLNISNKYF